MIDITKRTSNACFVLPGSNRRQPARSCSDVCNVSGDAPDFPGVTPFDSLFAAAQEGAAWAWERLYQDLSPAVRGYLVVLGAKDPDDLLGEVWLQVARNVGTFSGDEAGFRSWVFVVAHHRVNDERRRRTRRPEIPVDDSAPDDWPGTTGPADDEALAEVETERVVRLLATLTAEQRDVLTLRILGDLTVSEVAAAMGKTPEAVKALQRRGLRRLEKMVREGVPL
jgi:RNA polymerase sigma-70 factor (ECF subfamily)